MRDPARALAAEFGGVSDVPGPHPHPAAVLGQAGLHPRPGLRPRGRRGDHEPGDLPAGPRPRAVERGLRGAVQAPERRPLRREPQPALSAPPVPGDPQAKPAGRAGDLPRVAEGDRDRSARARHPLRRGRLGEPDAGRLGARLGGLVRRDGDHPVHLLPAGGRLRDPPGRCGADLRARADRHVPAGRRERLRHRVGEGGQVPRGLPPERGGDERVQLPRVGSEDALRPLRHLRGGVQAAHRAEAAAAGLRLLPEVLAHLQQPRRAGRDQRHRARGLHRPGPGARAPLRARLPGLARDARLPDAAACAAQGGAWRRRPRRAQSAKRAKGRWP